MCLVGLGNVSEVSDDQINYSLLAILGLGIKVRMVRVSKMVPHEPDPGLPTSD